LPIAGLAEAIVDLDFEQVPWIAQMLTQAR